VSQTCVCNNVDAAGNPLLATIFPGTESKGREEKYLINQKCSATLYSSYSEGTMTAK